MHGGIGIEHRHAFTGKEYTCYYTRTLMEDAEGRRRVAEAVLESVAALR